MILIKMIIFAIATVLKSTFGYEGVNLLFRVSPSRLIIAVLRKYGAEIGSCVRIQSPFLIHNADQREPIYSNLTIGDNCYIGRDCIFDLMEKITIGNQVTISHRAVLNTHTNAGKSPLAKHKLKSSVGAINIKDGAYLGINVTILESTNVGEKSIVGACSLVNKDIPGEVAAFGVPAKIYKAVS